VQIMRGFLNYESFYCLRLFLESFPPTTCRTWEIVNHFYTWIHCQPHRYICIRSWTWRWW